MRSILRTIILSICLVVPTMLCLSACDSEQTAKISSFSVQFTNANYTLVDDTITVTYGEDYRLSANDFSVTAIFDDETSRTLTANELVDYGFTYVSNIPDIAKTPVGSYTVSINHAELETGKNITLVVEKATINYSESDIEWSANEVAYDGTEKAVTITNLPDTLEVTYQDNAKTNPSEYTATVTISAKDGDNYDFAEITVEHIWEVKLINHTITYQNTYDLENNNQTTYTLLSETITLTPLKGRDYYTFKGWYYDGEKITTIPQGFTGGNITLEAKWSPIVYTITYQETFGLENTNPTTYTIEDGEITLSNVANRVDYTFSHWERVYEQDYKIEVSPITTVVSVSEHKGNITLKAIWDKKSEYDAFDYTVSDDCTKATINGLKNINSTSITIPSGVVAIADNAFADYTSLTTVNFEESSNALTIGDYAFNACESLTTITIPARVTAIGEGAFYSSGLKEINFASNSNLLTLGDSVFSLCTGLIEVTIPDSVVSMGQNVFSGCTSMKKVAFGKGMTVIGEKICGGSSTLREIEFKGEITSFHQNALNGVATGNITLTLNLNQKYLKKEVISTGEATGSLVGGVQTTYSADYRVQDSYYRDAVLTATFCGLTFSEICLIYDASNTTVTEFRSTLNSCGAAQIKAFKFILPASADDYFPVITNFISKYENGSIKLTIDGATSILAKAFGKNGEGYRLKEVIIGDTVTSIGDSAFEYCSYLQKVTFGKGLTSLGKFAFYECEKLEAIEIPDSVTSIGNNCFCNCENLESVKLSASITVLNNNVFTYCILLKSLIIPNGVTEIGAQTLASCEKLESIVIPDSVTTISNDATYSCKSLTKVYYTGTASDWNNIAIGDYNNPLNTATIYYYSESEPSTTGNYWHYVNGVPTAW